MEKGERQPLQGGDQRTKKEPVSLRGVVRVLITSFAIFLVSSAVSRTISLYAGQRKDSVDLAREEPKALVSPRNGTHPTLTTTARCTGDKSLPVLAGADVVSYFSLPAGSKPVIATDAFTATHDGYVFFFESAANQHAFEADPVKYIPAWGGFCSYGIANERVWTADNLGPFGNPSKWEISSDGRLHVFRSGVPMEKFLLQREAYLAAGDANWNAWFGETRGPLNTACFCADVMCDDN